MCHFFIFKNTRYSNTFKINNLCAINRRISNTVTKLYNPPSHEGALPTPHHYLSESIPTFPLILKSLLYFKYFYFLSLFVKLINQFFSHQQRFQFHLQNSAVHQQGTIRKEKILTKFISKHMLIKHFEA